MTGVNRPYTQLSENQVIQQSFDESKDALRILNMPISLPFKWDYFALVLSNDNTTETYTFKTGGSGGTTTGTVVLNYTNSTRDVLTNGTITTV